MTGRISNRSSLSGSCSSETRPCCLFYGQCIRITKTCCPHSTTIPKNNLVRIDSIVITQLKNGSQSPSSEEKAWVSSSAATSPPTTNLLREQNLTTDTMHKGASSASQFTSKRVTSPLPKAESFKPVPGLLAACQLVSPSERARPATTLRIQTHSWCTWSNMIMANQNISPTEQVKTRETSERDYTIRKQGLTGTITDLPEELTRTC